MIADRIAVYVIGAAILALFAAAGTQTWRLHSEKTAHAETKADYAMRLAAAEKTARDASEKNRQLEGELNAKAKENQDALNTAKRNLDKVRADLDNQHAVNGRLSNAISRYASGGGQPSAPACTAERERAETIGGLLEEALRSSAEGAIDAEGLAVDVRALLADGSSIRNAMKADP